MADFPFRGTNLNSILQCPVIPGRLREIGYGLAQAYRNAARPIYP